MGDLLSIIVMVIASFGAVISLHVAIDIWRRGPRGIKHYRHMQDNNCPTPNMCQDAGWCVMLCHEKNRSNSGK